MFDQDGETSLEETLTAIRELPDPETLSPGELNLMNFLYVHAFEWVESNPRFDGATKENVKVNALVLCSWWIRDHGLYWPDGTKA